MTKPITIDPADQRRFDWLRDQLRSGSARETILEAGLTLSAVGELIDVKPVSVWRYLAGQRFPRRAIALRLAPLLAHLQALAATQEPAAQLRAAEQADCDRGDELHEQIELGFRRLDRVAGYVRTILAADAEQAEIDQRLGTVDPYPPARERIRERLHPALLLIEEPDEPKGTA